MKKILRLGTFIFLVIIFVFLIQEKQANNLLQKEIINLRSASQVGPKGNPVTPVTIDEFIKNSGSCFEQDPPERILKEKNNLEEIDKVNNDSSAVKLVKSGCFNVFDAFLADLKNNGNKNPVLHLAPAGCGSCHTREVLVLEDNNIIFKTSGDNLHTRTENIKIPNSNNAFNALIVESAMFGLGEPSGCHEWYLETAYYWSVDRFHALYEKPIHKDECYKPAKN